MKFLDMLKIYMQPGSYRVCYTDTDSFLISMCESSLDDCVRPEKRLEYLDNIKPQWFAPECNHPNPRTCEPCKRAEKTPGMLKIEANLTSGFFLATSPKCYMMAESSTMGPLERKIVQFGSVLLLNDDENFSTAARTLLAEIEALELAEGDDTPYTVLKKGAKGCHRKIVPRYLLILFTFVFFFQSLCVFVVDFWRQSSNETAHKEASTLNSNGSTTRSYENYSPKQDHNEPHVKKTICLCG